MPSGYPNYLASLAAGSVDLPQFRRVDHTTFAALVASPLISPSYVRARPENERRLAAIFRLESFSDDSAGKNSLPIVMDARSKETGDAYKEQQPRAGFRSRNCVYVARECACCVKIVAGRAVIQ